MREIIVIGAGSEAKSVLAAAEQAGMIVRAIYDDHPSRWGGSLFGVVIVGSRFKSTQRRVASCIGTR